jgi:hypothetical protein
MHKKEFQLIIPKPGIKFTLQELLTINLRRYEMPAGLLLLIVTCMRIAGGSPDHEINDQELLREFKREGQLYNIDAKPTRLEQPPSINPVTWN